MCGFAGFFDSDSVAYDRGAVIANMSKAIAHRGPDSDGVFSDERCALGFRRLSIIDLAGGDQPIVTEDGRYVIVFNGEIYNYLELREELTPDAQPEAWSGADVPVLKSTNGIIAVNTDTTTPVECIKCGRCVDVCPMELKPL